MSFLYPLILSLLIAPLGPSFSSDHWPTEAWRTRSLSEAGIDEAKFARFLDYVFLKGKFETPQDCEAASQKKDKDFQTNALVIIKDSCLIYEKYVCGYTPNHKQFLLSISKSIMATLAGIAQFENRFHVTRPISSYVEVPQKEIWEKMKVDDLIRMSSGIKWDEIHQKKLHKNSLVHFLYGKGAKNIISYLFKSPPAEASGNLFRYSTGDSTLLTHALNQALGGEKALLQFSHDKLFAPLGIEEFTMERGPSGHFYGGSHIYLKPRDLAKIGLLARHRGLWGNKRLYAQDWHDYFTSVAPAWKKSNPEKLPVYGAQWWLNLETEGKRRPHPALPQDAFLAKGLFGQILAVVPSLDLVVVRNAFDTKKEIDANKMWELLMESLQ
ncbi:MAG: serine hydrolase [Bacteriovoracales bacterium]|nr:serine hydrolase [Bacteriovoracales bacterium]